MSCRNLTRGAGDSILVSTSEASCPTAALRSGSKMNISVKQNECLQLIQDIWQCEEQKIYQHIVRANQNQLSVVVRLTQAFYSLIKSRKMALAS